MDSARRQLCGTAMAQTSASEIKFLLSQLIPLRLILILSSPVCKVLLFCIQNMKTNFLLCRYKVLFANLPRRLAMNYEVT